MRFIKKLVEAGERQRNSSAVNDKPGLDDIILAGVERGLSMSDARRMQLGEIVDYCIEYNNRQKRAEEAQEESKKPKKRYATQDEIRAYFGR